MAIGNHTTYGIIVVRDGVIDPVMLCMPGDARRAIRFENQLVAQAYVARMQQGIDTRHTQLVVIEIRA